MRVPRTFAFVDLSGFTNYTAAFGDDAAGFLEDQHAGRVIEGPGRAGRCEDADRARGE